MASKLQRMNDSDDEMDEFMDKFSKEKYGNAFNENNWEEEFEKVPMFMKKAPEMIDPKIHPDLACLQSIIHDEDRPPEEQTITLKDEGNDYFKTKNYKKAVVSYTEGIKKKCGNPNINAILYTNRAAAHFHLGNMRSALNDAVAAKKLKPDHLKAVIRGAQCCIELHHFEEALQWCDEGLKVQPSDQKLQELRKAADKLKRSVERDTRKAKLKEKKECGERKAVLDAIQERRIKLLKSKKLSRNRSDIDEYESYCNSPLSMAEIHLDELYSQEATGARVFLDQQGFLHWPVLFLYPEHQQTDFVSAFCEYSSLIDHLAVMFGEEFPPWDKDKKYFPQNILVLFEDCETDTLFQVNPEMSLINVLQHKRYFVQEGTPSFIVLVEGSVFCKQYLSGKNTHYLK